MPYDFPRNFHRSEHPLEDTAIAEDLHRAAAFATDLDGHNVQAADFKANAVVAGSAYHRVYHALDSVDHGVPIGSTGGHPSSGNGYIVPNDYRWHAVNGGATVTVNSPGYSRVVVYGWLQYVWFSWTGGAHDHGNGDIGAGVVFGIMHDGSVRPESVTGLDEPFIKPHWPARWTPQRSSSTPRPGPGMSRAEYSPGMGPHTMAIRVQIVVDLPPGEHKFTMAARRINPADSLSVLSSSDYVEVFTTRLLALEVPVVPPAVQDRAGLTVGGIQAEEALSAGTTQVDLAALQARANDIKSGDLRRGALVNQHLPPVVHYADHFALNTSANLPNLVRPFYPGWEAGGIVANAYGNTGWVTLTDTAGATLQDSVPAAVDSLNFWLVVFANVRIERFAANTGGNHAGDEAVFGHLAIMIVFNDGTELIVPGSQALFNQWLTYSYASNNVLRHGPTYLDVPLLAVVDYSSAVPPNTGIDTINVVGAASDNNGDEVSYENHYGSLTVLALRKN